MNLLSALNNGRPDQLFQEIIHVLISVVKRYSVHFGAEIKPDLSLKSYIQPINGWGSRSCRTATKPSGPFKSAIEVLGN